MSSLSEKFIYCFEGPPYHLIVDYLDFFGANRKSDGHDGQWIVIKLFRGTDTEPFMIIKPFSESSIYLFDNEADIIFYKMKLS